MSLLYPLYLLGAAAIALPIAFHLLRRTPQGRVPFSSLMFLASSPPRLTRRNRLNHLLLLLLRASSLVLLALAFARPLWREAATAAQPAAEGERVAILVDTSASMRRGDLWRQAVDQCDRALAELNPQDDVALVTFDATPNVVTDFAAAEKLPPAERRAWIHERLSALQPTWHATDLGAAALASAELSMAADDADRDATRAGRVVLISDLAEGSETGALASGQWPEGVTLDVRRVAPSGTTNAAPQLAPARESDVAAGGASSSAPAGVVSVRVVNSADARRESFFLVWGTSAGPRPEIEPVRVYVPPGESRVVRVPRPAARFACDRLTLTGDDDAFDNVLYIAPPHRQRATVVWLGDDKPDDPADLRYYLEQALAAQRNWDVTVSAPTGTEPLAPPAAPAPRLIVATGEGPEPRLKELRRAVESGATLLLVARSQSQAALISALTDWRNVSVEEAAGDDYALLGQIDYQHRLFAAFDDPRFADFTSIRFWHHRRFAWEDGERPARVVAKFDHGDPAVIEQSVGQGNVVVLAAGWHPADSQWSRSTKFVPLVAELLHGGATDGFGVARTVGDRLTLAATSTGEMPPSLYKDDHKVDAKLLDARDYAVAEPGVYRWSIAADAPAIAVNLTPRESRTAPLATETIEGMGGAQSVVPEKTERTDERQLSLADLESRQKLWRWLALAALGLVLTESFVSGLTARRQAAETASP